MNLYIIHYHLQRCGVTRIISSQVESLNNCSLFDNIYILSGSFPEKIHIHGVDIIQQKLFDYLLPGASYKDYHAKGAELYNFLKENITKEDIIHAHNSSLGKNPLLTYVLYRLVTEGYTIFYHCHDFAEDRPENYVFLKQIITKMFNKEIKKVMYPQYTTTMFGVLTSFDSERLKGIGIGEDCIKRLPNPVNTRTFVKWKSKEEACEEVCKKFSLDPALPLMLYPVRVIQRKNIGEYLLLSSLFRKKASWMVTLPPNNPIEIKHYKQWKAFAEEINSPVIFEAGDIMDFNTLMYAAYRTVTTSIKEGFGMCFLEPWIFDTPVAGRTIPYVLSDFRKDKMQFMNIYERLIVTWNEKTNDFPYFPVKTQMEIIKKLLNDRKMRDEFLSSTGIENILFAPVTEDTIMHNKEIIRENYSIEKYGNKLERIYRELSGEM